MATISKYYTSRGQSRYRARVRLKGQDISMTFSRKSEACHWARYLERRLHETPDFDPRWRYKLVRIN